jgi:hypothetical protein
MVAGEQEQPVQEVIRIDPLSATSLYLKLLVNGHDLGNASGFVVRHAGRHFLVTNWHVLAGYHPETDQPLSKTCGLPDEVRIAFLLKGGVAWQFRRHALLHPDGAPMWTEHRLGKEVDIACLELKDIHPAVQVMPLDLDLANVDLLVYPGMPVHVIGHPLALRPNVLLGVWKTGHIASDPDYPYKGHAAFLIDATTREGMSGSPVVARVLGARMTSKGFQIGVGLTTRLLGIYSSRLPKDAELGCVWKPSLIREVLDRAVAHSG